MVGAWGARCGGGVGAEAWWLPGVLFLSSNTIRAWRKCCPVSLRSSANTQAGTSRFKRLLAEEEEKHSPAKIASGSTIEETEVPYTPAPPEQPVFRQRGGSAGELEGGGSDVACLWCVSVGVVLSLCLLVIYVYMGP